jgi:hypothetical protein
MDNMNLPPETQKSIVEAAMAAAQRESRRGVRTSYQQRVASLRDETAKDASVASLIQTSEGIRKLGVRMASPVLEQMDYAGIYRQVVITQQMRPGVPLIIDRDFPNVPAAKIASSTGAVRWVMKSRRITLDEYPIAARIKIPITEIYKRWFRAIDRAKDKLASGLYLREDNLGFLAIDTVSESYHPAIDLGADDLTKDGLSIAFAAMEDERLKVGSVLCSPWAVRAIRNFDWQVLTQAVMQEILDTGYMGELWGAQWFISDQIPNGTCYVLATPRFLGWLPIRKDVTVEGTNDLDYLQVGFVGYILEATTIHNAKGVVKVEFTPTTSGS